MSKSEAMAIGTLLKALLALIGIIATLTFLVIAVIKRDNGRLKKAGLIFAGTCLALIILSTIEFLFIANW